MGGFGGLFSGMVGGFGAAALQNKRKAHEEDLRRQELQIDVLRSAASWPGLTPEGRDEIFRQMQEIGQGKGKGGKSKQQQGGGGMMDVFKRIMGGGGAGAGGAGGPAPTSPVTPPFMPGGSTPGTPGAAPPPTMPPVTAQSGEFGTTPPAQPPSPEQAGAGGQPMGGFRTPSTLPPIPTRRSMFYSPAEQTQQEAERKAAETTAQEKAKAPFVQAEETRRNQFQLDLEKARHENVLAEQKATDERRTVKGVRVPVPNGEPWEYGTPVTTPDGRTIYTPADPPESVRAAHLTAVAMTNAQIKEAKDKNDPSIAKSERENFDTVWLERQEKTQAELTAKKGAETERTQRMDVRRQGNQRANTKAAKVQGGTLTPAQARTYAEQIYNRAAKRMTRTSDPLSKYKNDPEKAYQALAKEDGVDLDQLRALARGEKPAPAAAGGANPYRGGTAGAANPYR